MPTQVLPAPPKTDRRRTRELPAAPPIPPADVLAVVERTHDRLARRPPGMPAIVVNSWTQGEPARDLQGRRACPLAPNAVCWCLGAALDLEAGLVVQEQAEAAGGLAHQDPWWNRRVALQHAARASLVRYLERIGDPSLPAGNNLQDWNDRVNWSRVRGLLTAAVLWLREEVRRG